MDPDPGGPKTCGSGGSGTGSTTLLVRIRIRLLQRIWMRIRIPPFFPWPKIEISIIFFKINNQRPKVLIYYIVADSCVVVRRAPASHRGGPGSIPGRDLSVSGPLVLVKSLHKICFFKHLWFKAVLRIWIFKPSFGSNEADPYRSISGSTRRVRPRMLLKMRADLDELESPVWSGAGRLNICLIQLLLHHLEIKAIKGTGSQDGLRYCWHV